MTTGNPACESACTTEGDKENQVLCTWTTSARSREPGPPPARCPDIPGGLRQGTGGRQRTRRIVDENLRDLLSAPDQQRALTLDDLVLASGDPVPVVHCRMRT